MKNYYGLKGKMVEMARISQKFGETMITSGRNKIIAVKALAKDGAIEIINEKTFNGKTTFVEFKLNRGEK